MAEADVDFGKVIEGYIKLRDLKAAVVDKHKQELEPITKKMQALEGFLLKHLQSKGLASFKAKGVGTAFVKDVSSATVEDWDSLLNHVRETDGWDLLTRAVSKDEVKAYIEAHGDIPPGVKYNTAQVCQIRRTA